MNAAERLADPSFGNYMLNGLREIALPEPPSYRPQTIGWAILAVTCLLALTLWSLQQYRSWQRNRYRRVALRQLAELEQRARQPATRAAALQELSKLLKRTALATYPRDRVARLHGESWLAFLDRTYDGNDFANGRGQHLVQFSYQPPDTIARLSLETIDGAIASVRDWIVRHERGK